MRTEKVYEAAHLPPTTLLNQSKPTTKGIGQESSSEEDNQESYHPRILVRTEKRNNANSYEKNP